MVESAGQATHEDSADEQTLWDEVQLCFIEVNYSGRYFIITLRHTLK